MLTGSQLREKYLSFFKSRDHAEIPSAPLIPQNDPTTLFVSSGMQPLVPYLLGEKHPKGVRLVNSQKSFRAQDIEEVGDNRHTTFFEMLGNWSLGDYFKEEQLSWVWEFFTKELGLPKEKLHVTLFEGNKEVGRDEESTKIWQKLGVPENHIHYYDAKKNWWSRSGTPDQMPVGEPGGPDSEVFYDFGEELKLHESSTFKDEKCHVNCDCGRFMEIGNSVFMQYQKQADGSLKELSQKNVDFGGGLERILAAVNNTPDVFKTDLFWPIIKEIEKITGKSYEENAKEMRIIADHLKASVFMISEDLEPSNKQQGYVLRRLLRRSMVVLSKIKDVKLIELLENYLFTSIINKIVEIYKERYSELSEKKSSIDLVVREEWVKFKNNMHSAYPAMMKIIEKEGKLISGSDAFTLFESHGVLPSVLEEVSIKFNKKVDWEKFEELVKKHQQTSRSTSAGMFKGGLADQSETVTKYHTATHLLQQALRDVLGEHVHQAGSNLTGERLRFDFTHDKALTDEEIKKVEEIINEKISSNLPVAKKSMPYQEAIDSGALAFFKEKYPDVVTVYTIGDYSKELCGGPHVNKTGEIGKIKVVKQESLGSSGRRVYLKLDS